MNLRTIAEAVEAYKKGASEADVARLDFFEGMFKLQQERADVAAEVQGEIAVDEDAINEVYGLSETLLEQAPVKIDADSFAETCEKVGAYLAEGAGLDDEVVEALESFDWPAFVEKLDLEQAGSKPPEFVEDCLKDFDSFEVDSTLPAGIVMMVVSFSLRAHIQSAAQALFGAVKKDVKAGSRLRPVNCPVCGSPAALSHVAMAAGIEGRERKQFCSMCGTTWPFDRMRCGVCGVDNPQRLHYFNVEGDDSHRLQNCEECGQYQRVFFEESLEVPVALEVEDVVMAKLDRIALDPRFRAE